MSRKSSLSPRHPNPCIGNTGQRADWSLKPMDSSTLKLFTDAHILRQVGRPLLTEFFERFTHLLAYKHFLPSPRPDNEEYFDCLANVLEHTDELPSGLAQALIEVEEVAARDGRVGAGAALGNGSEDAESTSFSEVIRAWLGSHTGEAPPAEASERACEERASSPPPSSEALRRAGQPSPPPASALIGRGKDEESGKSSETRSKSELPDPALAGSDQQAFERLARLSPAQYDRARRAEARQL